MNTKNDVEVIINGKQYTISGYESSEYLQRIATHINDKYAEFRQDEGYNRLDADMKNILLAINLSDDYYKVQESIQDLQREKEDLEKEIFNMKHDMIAMKSRLEDQEKKLGELKKDKKHSEHEVIRLETELKNAKEDNETLISIQSMAGAGMTDGISLLNASAGKESEGEIIPLSDNNDTKEELQPFGSGDVKEDILLSDSSNAEEFVQPEDSESVEETVQPDNHDSADENENGGEEEKMSGGSEAESGIETEQSDASGSIVPEIRNTGNRNTKNSSRKSRKKRRR